jgi:hypothetical protein
MARKGLLALLAILLLSGCRSRQPAAPPTLTPTVGPNVTGTIEITRIGTQLRVAWQESGTVDFISYVDPAKVKEGGNLVAGTGAGTAAYDGAGGSCPVDEGSWQAKYTLSGFFDPADCTLTVRIEDNWTNGSGTATCAGMSNTQALGDYVFNHNSLAFANDVREVHRDYTDAGGVVAWSDKFRITSFDDKGLTGCKFQTEP